MATDTQAMVISTESSLSTGQPQGPKVFGSLVDEEIIDEIPRWPSLGHYVLDRLSTHNAHKVIFIDYNSGKEWTGKELHDKILNIASALVDVYQFKPGTAVCINYHNSDICTILALAIIVAGGIVACAYPKDPYQEMLYLARKVEPKFLFCTQSQLNWATKLEADMGYPVFGIVMSAKAGEQHLQFQHIEHLLNYNHQDSKSIRHLPVACLDIQLQPAFILMSSGTTGKPKAVPATHWNCLVDLLRFGYDMTRFQNIVFASSASLDYVSGRLLQLGAIQAAYKLVLLEGFDVEKFAESIQRYKVNVIYMGAASFYNLMTSDAIGRYDVSSLRVIFPMGAKVTYLEELAEFLKKHHYIKFVRQGYGTSEFCGAAYISHTPEGYLKDPDNCGQLIAGVQAKVVDTATGKLLGPNQPGMLHVRSMSLFPGYYDIQEMHERQRERLQKQGVDTYTTEPVSSDLRVDSPYIQDNTVFDSEGYYITGDIGYFNEKDELYIVGRQKELMSCRGAKKVLPQELEELIIEHGLVSNVCVFGVPKHDEPLLICPRAFIVPKVEVYDMKLQECRETLERIAKGSKQKFSDNNNDSGHDEEEKLEHKGTSKICRLDSQIIQLLAEDIMSYVNERVGWEKQLTGGIVILDDIPTLRETGKMNKSYLRKLTTEDFSIYGDRSSV